VIAPLNSGALKGEQVGESANTQSWRCGAFHSADLAKGLSTRGENSVCTGHLARASQQGIGEGMGSVLRAALSRQASVACGPDPGNRFEWDNGAVERVEAAQRTAATVRELGALRSWHGSEWRGALAPPSHGLSADGSVPSLFAALVVAFSFSPA